MRILDFTKYIMCLAILVLTSFGSYAQIGFSMGPKGGATFTTLKGSDADESHHRTGWVGGIFTNLSLLNFLSIQPEFLVQQKGATTYQGDNTTKIKIDYFQIPVLLKLRLPLGKTFYPHIFAGPNFAYRIGGSYSSVNTISGEKRDINISSVRRHDNGGVAGAGIDIEGQKIFFTLDARYGFAFNSLGEHTYTLAVKNRDLTVMAGLGFRIGSKK